MFHSSLHSLIELRVCHAWFGLSLYAPNQLMSTGTKRWPDILGHIVHKRGHEQVLFFELNLSTLFIIIIIIIVIFDILHATLMLMLQFDYCCKTLHMLHWKCITFTSHYLLVIIQDALTKNMQNNAFHFIVCANVWYLSDSALSATDSISVFCWWTALLISMFCFLGGFHVWGMNMFPPKMHMTRVF